MLVQGELDVKALIESGIVGYPPSANSAATSVLHMTRAVAFDAESSVTGRAREELKLSVGAQVVLHVAQLSRTLGAVVADQHLNPSARLLVDKH